MMRSPYLTNVIGVGQFCNNTDLNLNSIAEKVEGSRLNTRKFPGLIIRKTKPKGTVLLFKSNKFIIVGAQSAEDCEAVSRRIAKDIQKVLSIPQIRVKCFKISNLIANANLGYPVNIGRIAELPNAYKDDKSAGVFVKMPKVKCVIIFQSGKVILNGATQMADIQEAYSSLLTQFLQYKLKTAIVQPQECLKGIKNSKNRGKTKKDEGEVSESADKTIGSQHSSLQQQRKHEQNSQFSNEQCSQQLNQEANTNGNKNEKGELFYPTRTVLKRKQKNGAKGDTV